MSLLLKALAFGHKKLAEIIKEGDVCLDATCGNGKDSLFLAECVGREGKVYAFDIQEKAILNTRILLKKHNFQDRVLVFQESHTQIIERIKEPLKAAVFNLGYLPGGDQALITRPETTIKALQGVLSLLLAGGIVSIVIYSGHPGGQEEKEALQKFLADLDQNKHTALHYSFINQVNNPPELFLIEKNNLLCENNCINLH